jgi:hypothetical protein
MGRLANARRHRPVTNWRPIAKDGRLYWLDVPGKMGWRARYLKEVDANEQTVRFWQEIYDAEGSLVEVHQKYPIDLGHKHIEEPRQ